MTLSTTSEFPLLFRARRVPDDERPTNDDSPYPSRLVTVEPSGNAYTHVALSFEISGVDVIGTRGYVITVANKRLDSRVIRPYRPIRRILLLAALRQDHRHEEHHVLIGSTLRHSRTCTVGVITLTGVSLHYHGASFADVARRQRILSAEPGAAHPLDHAAHQEHLRVRRDPSRALLSPRKTLDRLESAGDSVLLVLDRPRAKIDAIRNVWFHPRAERSGYPPVAHSVCSDPLCVRRGKPQDTSFAVTRHAQVDSLRSALTSLHLFLLTFSRQCTSPRISLSRMYTGGTNLPEFIRESVRAANRDVTNRKDQPRCIARELGSVVTNRRKLRARSFDSRSRFRERAETFPAPLSPSFSLPSFSLSFYTYMYLCIYLLLFLSSPSRGETQDELQLDLI